MKLTRREFVKQTAVAGAGVALLTKFAVPSARAINNSPPRLLTKWLPGNPLRGLGGPTGIPVMSAGLDPIFPNTNLYQIGVGEFTDQLHPNLPPTRLWGYYDLTTGVQRHLGGVIVATRGTASRIRFTNNLPSRHILPLDITLPGANLAQNRIATHLHGGLVPWISDGGPFDWFTPGCTGYATGLSFLNGPGGVLDNIPGSPMEQGQADYFYPNDQSTRLQWYHDHAWGQTRLNAYAGIASGYLLLDPAFDALKINPGMVPGLASTLPLVFQDKKFVWGSPGDPLAVPPIPPTGTFLTDPTWQDVTRPDVQTPGSLWYEHTYNPKIWKLNPAGLPLPDPSVIAEFYGDTMLCNGTVYPLATLEAKRYRFFILNACNARFLNINTFVANTPAVNPDGITLNATTKFPVNTPGPAIIQIGTEAGYLSQEVNFTTSALTAFNPKTLTGNLIIAPGERVDVIVDLTGRAGQDIILYNDAPSPYPGGVAINDYYLGNGANPIVPVAGSGPDTRQILRIKVIAATTADPQPAGPILSPGLLDPAPLTTALPILATPVTPATVVPALTSPLIPRKLTLNEAFDRYGRLIQKLGTLVPQVGGGFGQDYTAPATEVLAAGTTEVWEIYNTTADTHPMHFHLVNVQVLSRQPFKVTGGVPAPTGVAVGPRPNELGWKETVQMNPGEITRVLMKFDLPTVPFIVPKSTRPMLAPTPANPTGIIPLANEYVWHCHILEHEEHDMMRPLVVVG